MKNPTLIQSLHSPLCALHRVFNPRDRQKGLGELYMHSQNAILPPSGKKFGSNQIWESEAQNTFIPLSPSPPPQHTHT